MSARNSQPIMEDQTTEVSAAVSYPLDDPRHVSTPAGRFRRQLLKGAAGTVVGAAVVYFGWTRYLFAPPPRPKLKPGNPGLRLGPLSDFAPGAPPKQVSVALPGSSRTAPYLVENIGGAFRVLSAVCTHQGCTVAWSQPDAQFVCPCHGARYDITGKNVAPPAPSPLPVVPCHVRNGALYVQA